MYEIKKMNLLKLTKMFQTEIKDIHTIGELNVLKAKYLGKKGILVTKVMKFHTILPKDRKKLGIVINQFKLTINNLIDVYKKKLKKCSQSCTTNTQNIDVTLNSKIRNIGTLHPITIIIKSIEKFFLKLGFSIVRGLEIENDYYNFDALNIPKRHPARTAHDTFWFDSHRLLRTQTSNMQIRTMKIERPPIRIIVPGKVYRNDYDITHTPMFHQIEGLIVDKNVNFSNLKWILETFLTYFFKNKIKIRFRPSYFPFTFLSSEVDILQNNNNWLEVLGCGMVHPTVLRNVNVNSKIYSGCAFGLGVERLAMLRYGISDIRSFFENDVRLLRQFKQIGIT